MLFAQHSQYLSSAVSVTGAYNNRQFTLPCIFLFESMPTTYSGPPRGCTANLYSGSNMTVDSTLSDYMKIRKNNNSIQYYCALGNHKEADQLNILNFKYYWAALS